MTLVLQPQTFCQVNTPSYGVIAPRYGRYLDEFHVGDVYQHPRGFSFERGHMLMLARCFHQANPLYLNQDYARAHGFDDVLASPQLVFNVALSLGVQNDSEQAMANLGYYHASFLHPVYAGDTLSGLTRVIDVKDRGVGKPGIVSVETLAINQHQQVVVQYQRKIMVHRRPDGLEPLPQAQAQAQASAAVDFPWQTELMLQLPPTPTLWPQQWLTGNGYGDSFNVGDVILHRQCRTITDEHYGLTYQVGNTHPLHFDRQTSAQGSGPMSGEPIVYGGLVFGWLEGLASRDISENAWWDAGFTEGYHTQPVKSGDTLAVLSRIMDNQPLNDRLSLVTMQLVGLKNTTAASAWQQYGRALFDHEHQKARTGESKITDKIFEIQRRLIIKRR